MVIKAEEYLRKGDEATLAKMDSANPFVRHIYSKIAQHWHELAERIEREQAAVSGSALAKEAKEPPSI